MYRQKRISAIQQIKLGTMNILLTTFHILQNQSIKLAVSTAKIGA